MLSSQEIIIKLLLGTLLGGIIGFERQTHGRPAGFRTQLLVCVSCVLLMVISESYSARYEGRVDVLRFDPTRIAAGAMTGVGFLGAGVILKTGVSIQGLTTAACIWIVSAIGLAIGAGQYIAGVTGFGITFFSLWFLRIVEKRIPRQIFKYVTVLTDGSGDENSIRGLFQGKGFEINKVDCEVEFPKGERRYILTISSKEEVSVQELIAAVSGLPFVKRLEIKS